MFGASHYSYKGTATDGLTYLPCTWSPIVAPVYRVNPWRSREGPGASAGAEASGLSEGEAVGVGAGRPFEGFRPSGADPSLPWYPRTGKDERPPWSTRIRGGVTGLCGGARGDSLTKGPPGAGGPLRGAFYPPRSQTPFRASATAHGGARRAAPGTRGLRRRAGQATSAASRHPTGLYNY